MNDITSVETLAALREQGIFSPKISPFLMADDKEKSVLWARYVTQKTSIDEYYEEPRAKYYSYARANIPNVHWRLPVGAQEGLSSHAHNYLHSNMTDLIRSGIGLTLIGSVEKVKPLAILAKRILEEGYPTYYIDFAELLYLVERGRNDYEVRGELDWLFSLEALVIMDIPIQVPATAGTQALLGLLAGRTGIMFRTTILGVIGTADHPSLPTLTQDPRSVNPIVAKMSENEVVFDF